MAEHSFQWYIMEENTGQSLKVVIRSCAVRHYIVLHGYVPGDTSDIIPDVLSYRNGDTIMSYHMLLYRTR